MRIAFAWIECHLSVALRFPTIECFDKNTLFQMSMIFIPSNYSYTESITFYVEMFCFDDVVRTNHFWTFGVQCSYIPKGNEYYIVTTAILHIWIKYKCIHSNASSTNFEKHTYACIYFESVIEFVSLLTPLRGRWWFIPTPVSSCVLRDARRG